MIALMIVAIVLGMVLVIVPAMILGMILGMILRLVPVMILGIVPGMIQVKFSLHALLTAMCAGFIQINLQQILVATFSLMSGNHW